MPTDRDLPAWVTRSLTRRQMLVRSAQVGALSALGLAAVACGDDEGSGTSQASAGSTAAPLEGQIVFMNYPGWIGEDTVSGFEAANPGVTVKQVEGLTSGTAAAAAQVNQNKDTYDMTLGGPVLGEQL